MENEFYIPYSHKQCVLSTSFRVREERMTECPNITSLMSKDLEEPGFPLNSLWRLWLLNQHPESSFASVLPLSCMFLVPVAFWLGNWWGEHYSSPIGSLMDCKKGMRELSILKFTERGGKKSTCCSWKGKWYPVKG